MDIMTQQQMVEFYRKHLACPCDAMGNIRDRSEDMPVCDVCETQHSDQWFGHERLVGESGDCESGPSPDFEYTIVCLGCVQGLVNAEVDKKKEIEQDREWDAAASGGESRKYE